MKISNYKIYDECKGCGKAIHSINLALNYEKIIGQIRARQINKIGWFNVTPEEANSICSKNQ